MTPAQCEEARNALGWTIARLTAFSGVSERAIRRFEASGFIGKVQYAAIRTAFETAGIEFVPERPGRAGFRFRFDRVLQLRVYEKRAALQTLADRFASAIEVSRSFRQGAPELSIPSVSSRKRTRRTNHGRRQG